MSSVREKTPLQLSSILSLTVGAFYFSQNNTDEQNTQSFTETLSQPISQNVTANISYNVLWYLYAEGVLWDRNCAQKGSVKSVSSVREKTAQQDSSVPFLIEGTFYFSQIYTDEQNTQSFTETLSQPISQNLTAIFGSNVLWILYAGGVLWVRNVGGKVLLNLWVLWEKKLPTELFVCHLIEWVRSISHRITQMNRTHKASQRR